jgi:deoxyribonuclease-4
MDGWLAYSGMMMVRIGLHVSIAGSIDQAVDRAMEKGCDTFQIFTRNPRRWKFKGLGEDETREFIRKRREYGIESVVAHMPYLPNLASPKEDVYERSVFSLECELSRCGQLEIPYLVTHLGSHMGAGMEAGFKRIVDAVREATSEVENDVMVLLEITAGTKNSMGGTFEDLKEIIDRLEGDPRLGICFDTCHAFAAGYDLRTEEALEETMNNFDEVIGIDRLRVVHLSDALGDLNSRLDRHEHIGMGHIGEQGFEIITHHTVLRRQLMILETPIDERRDDYGNLKRIRELAG